MSELPKFVFTHFFILFMLCHVVVATPSFLRYDRNLNSPRALQTTEESDPDFNGGLSFLVTFVLLVLIFTTLYIAYRVYRLGKIRMPEKGQVPKENNKAKEEEKQEGEPRRGNRYIEEEEER